MSSYGFKSILCPIGKQQFDRLLGHRVETIQKDTIMANPKYYAGYAGQQRECAALRNPKAGQRHSEE